MLRLLEAQEHVGQGHVAGYRDDVRAMDHYIADAEISETENVLQHRPLFGREVERFRPVVG